jgi:RND family efflux transporter MFP subunit
MSTTDQNGTPTPTSSTHETDARDRQHPHHEHHASHHADVGAAPVVKPASTRRVATLAIGAVVMLGALLLAAFLPRHAVSRELAAEVAGQDTPPAVQVATVTRAVTGGDLTLPGTIQPLHEGAIYARVGGYVKTWNADIGRVVHTGDVLAEIDAPELEQEVQQATQQLAQTHAALSLAKADLARWKVLAADSAVSREEYDQKEAAYEAAVANSGAAEANLRRLTETQHFTRVTAPFTGVITARNVDIGSLISANGATSASVSAGGPPSASPGSLFRIAQTDTVRTYITVPQAYALSMTPGLSADVTVQELPNRTFVGRIVRTSQAIDVSSRTLLTEVDIVNPGLTLLAGMYAQVHMRLAYAAPALVIPAPALFVRSSGTQIVTVDHAEPGQPATIHFRPVVVGRDYGGTVEIQSGATEGMVVILSPSADLEDGMRVVVAAPKAQGPGVGSR